MKYALLGNPNTGKSSVFNMLTGLRQHVGNFPGVTVDKKYGSIEFDGNTHELVDYPGTYSIYPRSEDEKVVYEQLCVGDNKPDVLIAVVDASNLERNLLFFSQLYDLGKPILMVLNMVDLAERNGVSISLDGIQRMFPETTIISTNARVKIGKSNVIKALKTMKSRSEIRFIEGSLCAMEDVDCQEQETKQRYSKIQKGLSEIIVHTAPRKKGSAWDKWLLHPVFGYVFFAAILLLIFQSIYSIAALPMDLIDGSFVDLSTWMKAALPAGVFTDLITQGLIPGIGGVVIFIPQIALLFLFIGILEETGYLARVVFILDRLMRPLGLNGKSVVPLMSSVACAIPGVMAARTISDRKERLITILVAPLMSCSARIPVYTLLIALVIPQETVLGFLNLQGLVLFGLYFLGTAMALLIALLLRGIIRKGEKGFLMLELPSYKLPRVGNLFLLVWEKVKIFVWDAGKIILAISVVLWFLASYGPSESINNAEKKAIAFAKENSLSEEQRDQLVASGRLEGSYIGHMGKWIEPAIRPLGYDWKIGIALITSFAAREVFVGSMATIYAVQDDGETNSTLLDKMRKEKNSDGSPVYSRATGLSLMVFYAFAMMCMATLAVVKRETKSWKWPMVQLAYMGILAYGGALLTYLIAS